MAPCTWNHPVLYKKGLLSPPIEPDGDYLPVTLNFCPNCGVDLTRLAEGSAAAENQLSFDLPKDLPRGMTPTQMFPDLLFTHDFQQGDLVRFREQRTDTVYAVIRTFARSIVIDYNGRPASVKPDELVLVTKGKA